MAVERALDNLIGNGLRYGSEVRASVRVTPSEVHFIIEDNGPGIPMELKQRVFEPFYTTTGGSGLGLAIVKHILEAHDQEVFVQSAPDQGSTFSFTLNKAG